MVSQKNIAVANKKVSLSSASSLEQAKHFWHAGRWQDAISQCRLFLETHPRNLEAQTLIGDALLQLEKLDEAIQLFKGVLRQRPDMILLRHKLSVALSRANQFAEADEYYTQIFEKQPDFEKRNSNSFSVQRQSGDFFFRKMNWARAVSAYQRAVEIRPTACWEYINLGRSQAKLGNNPESIASLEKAVAADVKNAWAYYYLSESLFEQDQLTPALDACRQAMLLMPSHVDAETLITKINSRIRYLKQTTPPPSSSSGHSASDSASDRSASDRSVSDRSPDAPLAADEALSVPSASRSALQPIPGWDESYRLGKSLQTRGDLENAAQVYYQSIIKNPYHSWLYHDLGDVNLKLGRWHEAIAAYQQAIRLNPDYFWSGYNLGLAYRNIKDWQSAVALYRSAIAANPGLHLPIQALEETLNSWYAAMMQIGDQFFHADKETALKVYRKAVEIYQKNLFVPSFDVARATRDPLRVLLIVDDHLPQCLRYRVQQKIEQLTHAGFESAYYAWTDMEAAKNQIAFSDIVIFYRTPAFPATIQAIEYAKAIKKIVFYEIDDLIFTPKCFPEPIEVYGGQLSEQEHNDLAKGTVLFQAALKLCDLAIASTPPLLKQMEKIVGAGNCYLHRNAIDSNITAALDLKTPKIRRDYVSIFYGSGTKAHNQDFDELVAPALTEILRQYPHVRLTLMGYLVVPEMLTAYEDRIDRIELVEDIAVYYEFLRQADIAIAVLQPTPVNNCKSELKWFEAASFKIPTVVSNTEVYIEAIESGKDGFIAANTEEWFVHLERLVTNEALRHRVGEAAYSSVMQKYSLPTMAENIRSIMSAGVARHRQSGNIAPPSPRAKLLIVNVFYPPQSIGGATRIVKDNVDVLTAQYGREYEISVFTTDNENPDPYKIEEYSHDGILVTKVSTPMMAGMDWQCQNSRIYELFKDYLLFNQPDLIHFHCVQRLTASVLEAAADLDIPYVVTAHDAWWISDHQFLVNEDDIECDYQQNDPIVTLRDAKDVTASMQRKLYLRKLLNQASEVLTVSEAFANLYRQNGFAKTKANRNGIAPQVTLPKELSKTGRVRIAHIGGMAAHKGYFLFKEAVESAELSNTEVLVINHAQTPGTTEQDQWNGTPVTFRAKFKQEEINQLYSQIDVLVAPSMWPESFGLVTREAVAAGVWVITSDKGAIGEDIIPGVTGHICAVDSVDPLIEALREIDTNFSFKGISDETMREVRTTEAQVKELNAFYRDVLNRNTLSRNTLNRDILKK